jgi:hypothetical protein
MKSNADKILKSKKATLKRVLSEIELMAKISKTENLSAQDFEYQTLLYKVRNFINAQDITVN